MDHFKLRVHDGSLYKRVQISATQKFFPIFQKGGNMDGIRRDIGRRLRRRTGTTDVDLDSAILSGVFLFSASPFKEESVEGFDQRQCNVPPVVYGLKSGLCSFFVVDDFPYIILTFCGNDNPGVFSQDFFESCDSTFDDIGAPCFLKQPGELEKIGLGGGLHHAVELCKGRNGIELQHTEASPGIIANCQGEKGG